jgi:hypothetical protein
VTRGDCLVCAQRTIVENTNKLIAVMMVFRFVIVVISVTKVLPDVGTHFDSEDKISLESI